MGATLQLAEEKQAYTHADRGTFLALENKLDLTIPSEGGPAPFNSYHTIVVNPKRCHDVAYAVQLAKADCRI